ncbi:MAG TPA: YdcF family protein [Rhizomicrobium sp.]
MITFVLTRYLLDPAAWVFYLMLASLIAGHYKRMAWHRGLLGGATVLLFALLFLPIDQILARPLENTYPRPPLPAHVDGIVVLDGSVNVRIFASRHVQGQNQSTLRILAGADLAKRYPGAKLVYSGENGGARQRAIEHQAVETMFAAMGIAPGRTIFERTSRDTGENLANSLKIVRPRPGETWMLVTSAIHMPRAMAIARKLGWTMVPWPSDYISTASGGGLHVAFPSEGLVEVDRALHEWIGIAVYRLTGRAVG